MIRNLGARLLTFALVAFPTTAGQVVGQDMCCGTFDACGGNYLGDPSKISMQGFNPAWDITRDDSIYLTVNVPADAALKVNGDDTAMVGSTRYFVIRHLEPGRKYKFEISAVTLNAAQIPLEETTTVVLAAGERHTATLAPYKRKKEILPASDQAEAEEAEASGA
jgi:uncharacterized protein (TIGR03000 family)